MSDFGDGVVEWADRFEQRERLATRIRNILAEYPPGVGPYSEFMQNADDAHATSFVVMLEDTPRPKITPESFFTPNLAVQYARPALVFYNSATFSDNDFDNLIRLGDSSKMTDDTQIGRYGLGFNVAYHYSDVVTLVSRDQIVLFDPHGTSLPKKLLGLRANFTKHSLPQKYRTQFQILSQKGLGYDGENALDGTMFWLPLRSAEAAACSELCGVAYSTDQVLCQLKQFAALVPDMLVFLRFIEKVTILHHDNSGIHTIASITVDNLSSTTRALRQMPATFLSNPSILASPSIRASFNISITSTIMGTPIPQNFEWLLQSGWLPGSELLEKQMHLKQWAGVALNIKALQSCTTEKTLPHSGRVYCYLPLPVLSGLPVSVNACWALSSNRQSLWVPQGGAVDEASFAGTMTKWNHSLLGSVLNVFYTEALSIIAQANSVPSDSTRLSYLDCYSQWPNFAEVTTPFIELAEGVYRYSAASEHKILWYDYKQRWCRVCELVAETRQFTDTCTPPLRSLLDRIGLFVTVVPQHILAGFDRVGKSIPTITSKLIGEAIAAAKATLTYEEAEHLVGYVVSNAQQREYLDSVQYQQRKKNSEETLVSPFSYLYNIKCVPLVGGTLGVLTADKSGQVYFSTPTKGLLSNFPYLLDASSPATPLLSTPLCFSSSNISDLTLSSLVDNIFYLLPKTWPRNVPIVPLSGVELSGSSADKATVSQFLSPSGITEGETKWTLQKPKTTKKKTDVGKKTTSKSDKSLPTSSISETSLHPEWDSRTISTALDIFWNFVNIHESSRAIRDVISDIGNLPIVHTTGGYVLTIAHAKSRFVLPLDIFSEDEIRVLKDFGCLFATHSSSYSILRNVLGTTLADSIKALSSSYDKSIQPTPDSISGLRQFVLKIANRAHLDSKSLGYLPLFKTLSGKDTNLLEKGVFGTPSDSDDYYAPTSKWDQALATSFPDLLLDYKTKEMQSLLKLAGAPRTSERIFLADFLYCRLTSVLTAGLAIELLNCVDRISPWTNPVYANQILTPLKKLPVVVYPDGTKLMCRDVYDPSDSLLVDIFGDTVRYPPLQYRAGSTLKILKHAGMMSLSCPDCFLAAARICAASSSASNSISATSSSLERHRYELACRLVEKLVQLHEKQKGALLWPKQTYLALSSIRFAPTTYFGTSPFPPLESLQIPTSTWYPPQAKAKLRESAVKTAYSAAHLNRLLDEEQEPVEEPADLEDELTTESFSSGVSCGEAVVLATPLLNRGRIIRALLPEAPQRSMSELKQSCIQNSAWICWTSIPTLPSCFNRASINLLDALGVLHAPPVHIVCNHMVKLVEMWSAIDNSIVTQYKNQLTAAEQGVMLLCTSALNHWLHRTPSGRRTLLRSLVNVPIVVLDDGELTTPSTIVMDANISELGAALYPPPRYIESFRGILAALGSPRLSAFKSTVNVRITASPPALVRDPWRIIQKQLDDPLLADVVFEVEGGEKVYAHKLVLGLCSEFFSAMFSAQSGFKERSATAVIQLPEIKKQSVLIFLKYLYGLGTPDKFLPGGLTQSNVDIVCGLLRLSDQFLMAHLKQWCEVYLSKCCSKDSMTVSGVCELFSVAISCDADQLCKLCAFNIRNLYSVISTSSHWAALPDHIKAVAMPELVLANNAITTDAPPKLTSTPSTTQNSTNTADATSSSSTEPTSNSTKATNKTNSKRKRRGGH
ncbi:Ubiquitin-associated/translation elongation factor EF1B [Pelomyxa schiedti]|nr:Ubiquitin-associated/translation elongation factor EF1B [Pelomyxa schiedti]